MSPVVRRFRHPYCAALMCLAVMACGVSSPSDSPNVQSSVSELSESAFCGAPSYDAATQAALFVYKDCDSGQWHLVATAGGGNASYSGRIVSDVAFTAHSGLSIEDSDSLALTSPNVLSFSLSMSNAWRDEVLFSFPEGASVRLEIDSPARTFPRGRDQDSSPASPSILVGASQLAVTAPVVLSESPTPSCGAPTINAATGPKALYAWKTCDSPKTWHFRATSNGGAMAHRGRLVSTQPFVSVKGYKLEANDGLELSSDGKTITFDFTLKQPYLDGFELELAAGANATLTVNEGGPLRVGEHAEPAALPFVFGDAGASPPPPPPPPPGATTLDPAGCKALSNAQLRDAGFEPVRAHGATANDGRDDSTAIQKAIDEANAKRRAVYFHPGTYQVSKQLLVRMDVFGTNSNANTERFGSLLVGSYCGSERPTLRLIDGSAPQTNEQVISGEPFAVITLWRLNKASSPPDDTHGGKDWNQVVRNLKIVLGNNPGAVGVRHGGAEGCSLQDVFIDATGGFAGMYQANSSGGYTHNVEIKGGKYGIFSPQARGGSMLLSGIKLYGQTKTPLAIKHNYPVTVVGFDIKHDDGQVISSVTGGEGSYSVPGEIRVGGNDSSGHWSLVDGKIEITGSASSIIKNQDRSLYMKNVYVRGATLVVDNASAGNLVVDSGASWRRVGEYAYAGNYSSTYGEPGKLIAGNNTDQTYFNGALSARSTQLTVSASGTPPADLVSRHLYQRALCNVEGKNVVFVTDHGADPNDDKDDTAGIQAAIDAAAASGANRVFLPSGAANSAKAIPNTYRISNTIFLGAHTQLCGVSRYATIIEPAGFSLSDDKPMLQTPNSASGKTVIADFKLELPTVGGSATAGYAPHIYAISWRVGADSLYRDVYYQRQWGDPGDRKTVIISGNGGGRWFGVTQHGGYLPPGSDTHRPFTNTSGKLVLSPEATHMRIEGTRQALTFYPYHCQHMTQPRGRLVELIDAHNVTFYGIKSEMGSVPEKMSVIVDSNPADLVPIWMSIDNCKNVALIGHEGMGQTDTGRGLIEIKNSEQITIANMARRGNGLDVSHAAVAQDKWFFVKEFTAGGAKTITAQGVLALYKSIN
jgi:hypothetical protein